MVSHHWVEFLGSIYLIICLFGLSSLGPDPWFYLSFFFIHLVSHNWDTILSQFILCSFCFLLLGHLPRFYLSIFFVSFSFLWLGDHPKFYLSLINCLFGFWSLGQHPMFYISLFFVHMVSHHWGVKFISLFILSLFCFSSFGMSS